MTTLVFAGNQFKYEMENVAKLFFPLRHFRFDYDGVPPEEDYILFTRAETGEGISLSVSVNLPDYRRNRRAPSPPVRPTTSARRSWRASSINSWRPTPASTPSGGS